MSGEVEETLSGTVNDGVTDEHFGIEQGVWREISPETSCGGVRVTHHRSGAKSPGESQRVGESLRVVGVLSGGHI